MITLEKMIYLRRVPLFAELHFRDLNHLASVVEEVAHRAGERIFTEGEPGDRLHVVVEGEVRLHQGDDDVALVGEAGYFGELSLLDGSPRSASATAKSNCLTLQLHVEDFTREMERHPEVGRAVIRELADRVRELTRRLHHHDEAGVHGAAEALGGRAADRNAPRTAPSDSHRTKSSVARLVFG